MPHKTQEQLLKELENIKTKIKVGDKFVHFKHPDRFYTIIAIGFIEATEELCITYRAEYGDRITWVRTESEFFSRAKLEDGKTVDRFTLILSKID